MHEEEEDEDEEEEGGGEDSDWVPSDEGSGSKKRAARSGSTKTPTGKQQAQSTRRDRGAGGVPSVTPSKSDVGKYFVGGRPLSREKKEYGRATRRAKASFKKKNKNGKNKKSDDSTGESSAEEVPDSDEAEVGGGLSRSEGGAGEGEEARRTV